MSLGVELGLDNRRPLYGLPGVVNRCSFWRHTVEPKSIAHHCSQLEYPYVTHTCCRARQLAANEPTNAVAKVFVFSDGIDLGSENISESICMTLNFPNKPNNSPSSSPVISTCVSVPNHTSSELHKVAHCGMILCPCAPQKSTQRSSSVSCGSTLEIELKNISKSCSATTWVTFRRDIVMIMGRDIMTVWSFPPNERRFGKGRSVELNDNPP
jgi:hypothetical protein